MSNVCCFDNIRKKKLLKIVKSQYVFITISNFSTKFITSKLRVLSYATVSLLSNINSTQTTKTLISLSKRFADDFSVIHNIPPARYLFLFFETHKISRNINDVPSNRVATVSDGMVPVHGETIVSFASYRFLYGLVVIVRVVIFG